ncbi:hypothetical protein RND81_04G087500 [Saponaria officinalis]|uniref:Uncharacterized protein n=1 Tax=Saponaria officinalis TaxID=3572 RepID=A0AAW1LHN4_SAPOF
MEQQRHTQRQLDTENEHAMPQTITPLKLEKHASVIYTHAVFYEVQHILWVWAGRKMYSIPDDYILPRWTKKSYRPIVCASSGKVDEDIDEADIRRVEMSKAWSEIYATMGLLDTAPHKHIKQLTKILRQFRESIADERLPKTKDGDMEDLLGCKATKDIDILPPNKAKNKGSGKRLTSAKENGIKKTEKRKQRCGRCKRWTNHNSRTCKLPFSKKPPSDDEEPSETEEVCIFLTIFKF